MKTLPSNNTPDEDGLWKPKPGEYFYLDDKISTYIFLCKWWDSSGMMAIRICGMNTGILATADNKSYIRKSENCFFYKPSRKLMKEFVPEIKEVDYVELFHKAETDVKEIFNGFITKITTVT